MAISGIVIDLEPDTKRRAEALERLAAMPQLELGPTGGRRVPAVMDTETVKEARACWDAIMASPGVEGIELVYVHYEDETVRSREGTAEEADR